MTDVEIILAQARLAHRLGKMTDDELEAVREFVRELRKLRRRIAWDRFKAAIRSLIVAWRS